MKDTISFVTISRLYKYFKPSIFLIVIYNAMCFADALLSQQSNYTLAQITDLITKSNKEGTDATVSQDKMNEIFVHLFISFIVGLLIDYANAYLGDYIIEKFLTDLKADLFKSFLSKRNRFFEKKKPDQVISSLLQEMNTLLPEINLSVFLPQVLKSFTTLNLIFARNWTITSIVVCSVILDSFLTKVSASKSNRLRREEIETEVECKNYCCERVSFIQKIRANNTQHEEMGLLHKKLKELFDKTMRNRIE